MRYAVVNERAGDNFSAYVPDLPGCIATAATPEAVESKIRAAIRFHVEGLHADGLPATEPTSRTETDDPFGAFSEWAGAIDDRDYADL